QEAVTSAGINLKELQNLLADFAPQSVLKATGVSEKAFKATVKDLSTIQPVVVMAGEAVAWQTNGLESVKAIQLLNVLAGSVNQPGGIFLPQPKSPGQLTSYAGLRKFISKMQDGKIQLALNWQSNLAFTTPSSLGFKKALENVPFLVSFSQFMDDTTLHADLIMPDHADLESWGDVISDRGAKESVIGLLQPVVKPLHDTRQFPEIMLSAAQQLGGDVAAALPWGTYLEMLKESVLAHLDSPQEKNAQQLWQQIQQQGGLFSQPRQTEQSAVVNGQLPKLSTPRFIGDSENYPLHLQVYLSPAFADGRNANLPWLQQMPDPMSTVVWDSWVEINPATARSRGIREGDLVEVASAENSIKLPAVIYPGIHPDVIAIPIGQGHENFGRYAAKRGVNPMQILNAEEDKEHSLPAWGATRVQLRQVSPDGKLVTSGHPEGSYRRDILGI
ncbi:MAG: nitrate reductase, partial [Gammaproteobacteria bacterium]|nr:nitrate reductase [Gammaproteobacteria bacterium]NIR95280.1 nitrate reductase [Gammaproteobacteria bacterium]